MQVKKGLNRQWQYKSNIGDHCDVIEYLIKEHLITRIENEPQWLSDLLKEEKRANPNGGWSEGFVSEKGNIICKIPDCVKATVMISLKGAVTLSCNDAEKGLAFNFLKKLPHLEGEKETELIPQWQTPYKILYGTESIDLPWCPDIETFLSIARVRKDFNETLDRVKRVKLGINEIFRFMRLCDFAAAQRWAVIVYNDLPLAWKKELAYWIDNIYGIPKIDWVNGFFLKLQRLRHNPS